MFFSPCLLWLTWRLIIFCVIVVFFLHPNHRKISSPFFYFSLSSLSLFFYEKYKTKQTWLVREDGRTCLLSPRSPAGSTHQSTHRAPTSLFLPNGLRYQASTDSDSDWPHRYKAGALFSCLVLVSLSLSLFRSFPFCLDCRRRRPSSLTGWFWIFHSV